MSTKFSRALLVLPLLCLLAAPAFAKKKKPKPPEPTTEERNEIRKLMMRVVRGRHPAKRSEASTKLAAYGPKATMAVPQLVNGLKDADSNAACAAAYALGKVGEFSKPAVKGLTKALTSGRSPELRAAAAEGLGLIGPNAVGAVPALIKSVAAKDNADLRAKAAEALGRIDGGEKARKRSLPALRGALGDSEQQVKLCAAIALVSLGEQGPELVSALAAAVRKSGRAIVEVRQSACEALGKLGPVAKDAVGALAEAAREETRVNKALPYSDQRKAQHEAMRRAAVVALGAIGGDEAKSALERAQNVPCLEEAAKAALAKLGG